MGDNNKSSFVLTFAGDTSLGDYYLRRLKNRKLIDRLENDRLFAV